MKRKNVRRYVAGMILIVWFVVLGVMALHRQAILDWLNLRDYHAPSAIAQLASDDTMTAYAQKVFYVNTPQLEPKTTFNNFCTNQSEQTVVLGCYHGGQNGIFVLDHIDGNSENNWRSNLRLVCPNCDSQLPTYKAKNKGSGRHVRRTRYAEGKSY